MPGLFSIEELVIDDSFYNYCFQKNETDILYWEQYIIDFPLEKEKIEEAKQIVLGLNVMLKKENVTKTTVDKTIETRVVTIRAKSLTIRKILRYGAAVAAVFTVVIIGNKVINRNAATQKREMVINTSPSSLLLFKTLKGERNTIILSDSTKFYLNAGSELRVDKGYGKENREVYLTGEALFDVTHNKSLPFIVHINKYDVKVLGTLFNVKAYPGDKQSVTSLIRGRVEIQMASSSRKILLAPNQKLVMNNNGDDLTNADDSLVNKTGRLLLPEETEMILPLSYNEKDHAVVETAWAQNRLEIVNESFGEMKEKLERWYNVKIDFKDEEVTKYTFSATFESETIEQVLNALQNAYHFNYEIKDNNITISK